MDAQLTVRLPEALSKKINRLARKLKLKRSDIVRLALERFAETGGKLSEVQGEYQAGSESRPLHEVIHSIEKIRRSHSLGKGDSRDLDEYLREDRDR
jgi:metal-responsive CopG/Arc/MetJ family transcriptional regulator